MGGYKHKKKKRQHKKNPSRDQAMAYDYVREWAAGLSSAALRNSSGTGMNSFLPPMGRLVGGNVVVELHAHSNCSDGTLSPSALVERAHSHGVKILALTDHDTMSGVPEAVVLGRKYGMRIIPGVEISTLYSPRDKPKSGESVHVLAYYGICGPAKWDMVDKLLTGIRDGRYDRARSMLQKLGKLKMPIKWDNVMKIAGEGVAPGRVHVARAMVEAGYVNNIRDAFDKYLHDGGPAYATGTEPSAESVVQIIHQTGGISALAHPWTLKNPVSVIKALKSCGLHAMEVYRSDGKAPGFGELADTHELVKIGGSDFHGRNGTDESEIGTVDLPITGVMTFLKMAQPIWNNAAKQIISEFVDEPSRANLEKLTRFGGLVIEESCSTVSVRDIVDRCISSWFSVDEKEEMGLLYANQVLDCLVAT